MEDKTVLDFTETKILMNLYLKEHNDDGNTAVKVLFHNEWKNLAYHISEVRETGITYLAEIRYNYWIVLHIKEDDGSEYRKGYLVDPCENGLSDEVITLLDQHRILVEELVWKISLNKSTTWMYSLYAAREISKSSPDFIAEFQGENNDQIDQFMDELWEAKMQLRKVIEKIKVCVTLFSSILKEKVPLFTNFKLSLHFIYFIETVALEDLSLNNQKIKEYLREIIGSDNLFIIKGIRYWLLHRNESYFIFPEQFHKYIFKETESNIIFQQLHSYLINILNIIYGRFSEPVIDEPKDILMCPNKMGNYIENKNITFILNDFSYVFIEEGFSVNKIKNPEKTMFNFIVNFIPLLIIQYGKQIKPFKDIVDLRHQLVHNIYILYQIDKELPYILIQDKLQELKEYLLIFNFCSRISHEIRSILSNSSSEEAFCKLSICHQSFKEEFKELYPKLNQTQNKSQKEKLEYLVELITQYLRILPLVDNSNKIEITNLNIFGFNLPKEYCRFTDIQRMTMFNSFNILLSLHESELSDLVIKHLKTNIQSDLLSLGLSDSNFKMIRDSLLTPEHITDDQLVKSILNHISTINKMKEFSNLEISVVIEDYYQILQKNCLKMKYHRKAIGSLKIENIIFQMKFSSGSFPMDLFTIVKNIIPFYFGTYCESLLFQNLTQIFNNDKILKILVNESFNSQDLYSHIKSVPLLVPLGVKLLCSRKLILNAEQECDLTMYCTKTLLEPKYNIEYLSDLFSYKFKNRNFSFFKEYLQMIFGMNLKLIYCSKLKFLFSIEEFQIKLMNSVKSCDFDNCPSYKELLTFFVNFKYSSTMKNYLNKNYEDAIEQTKGKTGFLNILNKLLEKNIIRKNFQFIKNLFLIAQINTEMGKKRKSDEAASQRFYEEALKMLNCILGHISTFNIREYQKVPWKLRIDNCKAKIYHALTWHSQSFETYKNMVSTLLNIKHPGTDSNFNEHSVNDFRTLMNSPEYSSAIKLCKNLNILTLLNLMNSEQYWLGKLVKMKETRNQVFIKAIEGFSTAHKYQKGILKTHNETTIFSLLKIGEITLELKDPQKYPEIYLKTAATLKIVKKGIWKGKNKWKKQHYIKLNKYLRKINTELKKAGLDDIKFNK